MTSETVVRTLARLSIVFATLFLVVAGYDNCQIAPALTLLGAIAGTCLDMRRKAEIGETLSDGATARSTGERALIPGAVSVVPSTQSSIRVIATAADPI